MHWILKTLLILTACVTLWWAYTITNLRSAKAEAFQNTFEEGTG